MNEHFTVNGEAVDPALVEEAFFRIKAAAEANSDVSCCERDDEFLAAAQQEVIDGILLAQEAERRIPAPHDSDLREALETTLRQWREHGASWDMLEARRSILRDECAARLRMERFTESLWRDLPELTDDDLRAWHAAHAEDFRVPAQVCALHMVKFADPANPWPTWHEMWRLREESLDGADFAELARTHTEKPGGVIDLGWISQERALHPFESTLFSLRSGETSPVIVHDGALHLVHAVETKPGKLPPFEEVIEDVRTRAIACQRRAALQSLAESLRQSARIERHQA